MLNLVYITCGSRHEAKKIAWYLLGKRLIACANIFPIESIYHFKGSIRNEKEFVLLVKTTRNFEDVKAEVEKVHSYDIPCIIRINAKANKGFEDWVRDETKA